MPSTFKSPSLHRRLRSMLRRKRKGSLSGSKETQEATYGSNMGAKPSNGCTVSDTTSDTAFDKESPMEIVASAADSSTQPFKHIALDHGIPSMRLIRIQPNLSSDGQIQCDIKQSTVDSTYVCLSYVWGDQTTGEFILIDGRPHWVGQNLFSFLKYARRKKHSQDWLWIDALCIDQSNLAERTHQVQHMGRIYSGAEQVVSWLGTDKEIAAFLINLHRRDEDSDISKTLRAFCDCEYWNRAWITQEVALARRLTLMARNVEVPLDDELSVHLSALDYLPGLKAKILSIQDLLDLHLASEKSLQPMLILLSLFNQKHCTIPRDRIFSLLALAIEGSHINADYEASDEALALRVLEAQAEGFCLGSLYTIVKCLKIPDVDLSTLQVNGSRMKRKLPVQELPATWMQEMMACDITTSLIETKMKNWRYREANICTRIVDASMEHLCTIIELDLSCPVINVQIAIIVYPDCSRFKYILGGYKSPCLQQHDREGGQKRFDLSFSPDQQTCDVTISLNLSCKR